jgi:hypothetical protein
VTRITDERFEGVIGECDLEEIGKPSIFKFTSKTVYSTLVVYYEVLKRELKRRPIYEFRCDERLKDKTEGSTRLVYPGLYGGLEHLKIQTRLTDERFVRVMGECVI